MIAQAEAYPQLMETLDNLRRRWRWLRVVEGGLLTLAALLGVLVLAVATDNVWKVDVVGRLVLFALLLATLTGGVLTWIVRRRLEDRRDDYFAALVEEKYPDLDNRFINALQLGRGNQNGFSAGLIAAIVHDAADATADLDLSGSVESKSAKRASLFALGAVILMAGYALALPDRFGNGLARVLAPTADIPPYTVTQVVEDSIKPGDAKVPEGSAVPFVVRVNGYAPETADLVRLIPQADGGVRKVSAVMQADKNASSTYLFTLPQAYESFDYYIVAHDGRSQRRRIDVVNLPQVESIALTYTPPAYTGEDPRTIPKPDGEISGIPGTAVHVEINVSKPLEKAVLVAKKNDGKEEFQLKKGADDRTWLADFTIWDKDVKNVPASVGGSVLYAPTSYQLRLKDADGYANYDQTDPLWRPIALETDQTPTVAITYPGRDQSARLDETIPLKVEAHDDHGLAEVRVKYQIVSADATGKIEDLVVFPHNEARPAKYAADAFSWNLREFCARHKELKKEGGTVQYWAVAVDRNNVTRPGQAESRRYSLYFLTPDLLADKSETKIDNYIEALEELVKLQTENRAHTYSKKPFADLVKRQVDIRGKTSKLAAAMEKDALPTATIVADLKALHAGLMAEAVQWLESGRDKEATDAVKADGFRERSLPVQDKIIAQLKVLLARLQRNEQAREALRKLEKKDKPEHKKTVNALSKMIKDLDQLLKDQTQMMAKFERLPKKPGEDLKEDKLKDALKELEEMQRKWDKWAKESVNEMAKLPQGFVDDFDMRKDVNKVFEEIEKAAARAKAEKMEVSLEDLGAGLGTKMKEDLEVWMMDQADAIKWVLEEPLDRKGLKVPEMPLPKALEDLVGDLLQKADEFDEEADDVTSAWGDNLDQAGWGTSDGPISTFSAKGKTGNDQPNNMELTGRSGDGRRGKSTGQMVGDTSRALPGRKTPARVGNERYEPGKLKQEGQDDPNGATGGGKKAGAGRKGLQGGTPPDFVRDMDRLTAKQAGLREKAEQVAKKLDTFGISSPRLRESIQLMKELEANKDLKYEDSARKRRVALDKLRGAFPPIDRSVAGQAARSRDLPGHARELLQAADEGYPPGYESLLKSYFKALSSAEK